MCNTKCIEISKRHSTRSFKKNYYLSEDDITKILKAGLQAPSGKNIQPWKFRIVTNEGEKLEIVKIVENISWVQDASVLIIVYLDTYLSYHYEKDIMSIGASIENMILKAQALEINSCWIGCCYDVGTKINDFFHISSQYKLMSVIAFGKERMIVGRTDRKPINTFFI